jgi:predicted Fe-Mo cluster-binding NifX family protein
MSKSAFAHWDNRVAPVFDVARQIRIVEAEAGRITAEAEEELPDGQPAGKAARLAELGVRTLVCGAVSRPAHELLLAYGIEVIPFVTGDLEDVVRAWLRGKVTREAYAMPGCGNRRRHLRRGQAEGRRGRGLGRMGGPFAGGSAGACVCPACGHREPHQRGLPCVQTRCPACGTAMARSAAE